MRIIRFKPITLAWQNVKPNNDPRALKAHPLPICCVSDPLVAKLHDLTNAQNSCSCKAMSSGRSFLNIYGPIFEESRLLWRTLNHFRSVGEIECQQ